MNNNAATFAAKMNLAAANGLVHGTLGALKKSVAFMGFDCSTEHLGDMTKVTVSSDGAVVGYILALTNVAGDAALVWA